MGWLRKYIVAIAAAAACAMTFAYGKHERFDEKILEAVGQVASLSNIPDRAPADDTPDDDGDTPDDDGDTPDDDAGDIQGAPAVRRKPPAVGRKPLAVPAVPSWVRFGNQKESRMNEHKTNKREVAKANLASRRLDLVMYGDSITSFHAKDRSVWDKHFGGKGALPLAMGGSTLPELAWRVMLGEERPQLDPRVAVILVGINDLKNAKTDPAPNLESLVQWMKAAMPGSKIVVLGLLPNAYVNVVPTNVKYAALAKRRGVTYLDCGRGMNPSDKKLFKDGTHPTAAGHDVVLRCLKAGVSRLLG